MYFFVSSPTTLSSSSLFVAAQSFCHGRRNLKASGQIGDLLASADGWLLCQHPARPLANFRRLCVLLLNIYSALVIRRMLTADLHTMESIGRIVSFRPECIERLWVCVIGTAVCSTGLLLFDFFCFVNFFAFFFVASARHGRDSISSADDSDDSCRWIRFPSVIGVNIKGSGQQTAGRK